MEIQEDLSFVIASLVSLALTSFTISQDQRRNQLHFIWDGASGQFLVQASLGNPNQPVQRHNQHGRRFEMWLILDFVGILAIQTSLIITVINNNINILY